MLAIVIARRQIQTFKYSGSYLGAVTHPYSLVQTLPSLWQREGLGVKLKNVHHANKNRYKNTQRVADTVEELSFVFFSPILLDPN